MDSYPFFQKLRGKLLQLRNFRLSLVEGSKYLSFAEVDFDLQGGGAKTGYNWNTLEIASFSNTLCDFTVKFR